MALKDWVEDKSVHQSDKQTRQFYNEKLDVTLDFGITPENTWTWNTDGGYNASEGEFKTEKEAFKSAMNYMRKH